MKKRHFDYFEYFISSAEIIKQSADNLEKFFKNFDNKNIEAYVERFNKLKSLAEFKQRDLCEQLACEFMPPIDRHDIFILAEEFKNIVLAIEEVVNSVYMFKISSIRTETIRLSNIILQCADEIIHIAKEIKGLKKANKIKDYFFRINTLKNSGNKIFVTAVKNVFESPMSDSEKLVWTVTLGSLKDVINGCSRVANVTQGIIIKNT